MDFSEVLHARRSIRAYQTDRAVPEDALIRIMEAVQCAPSACNRQPWKFLFVIKEELKKRIAENTPFPWLAQAPILVAALADYSSCWVRPEGTPAAEIDLGIAMEHLVLAARNEGLSTCWVCAYEKAKLNSVLNVAKPWSVDALSPLGYGCGEPRALAYKPVSEIFQVIR